jgi:hypothetical protein
MAGDLLVLADEAPTPALRLEARAAAGDVLARAGQFALAREQYDAVLAERPDLEPVRDRRAAVPAVPEHPDPCAAPRRVLMFSGHMVDAPDRASPRFPLQAVPAVAQAIARHLDALGAGPGDLALTQGAAGGDLLFAEACADRGVRVRLMQPFEEAEFLRRSVLPCADGEAWLQRWRALRQRLAEAPRAMPDALGPAPTGVDPFERCNRWMLCTALALGNARFRLIALWDGADADGPGGTAHMIREVQRRAGEVVLLPLGALAGAGSGRGEGR